MWPFLEIALTGVAAVTMHPLRSFVTVFCLCSVLVPYAVGIAISQGIQWESQLSIDQGADLYLSGLQFGQQVPLPLSAAAEIEVIEGVSSVLPRVVGEVFLGREQVSATLVGLPANRFPESLTIIDGRLPAESSVHELIVGTELAHRLKLKVGAFIPPFYSSASGERVSKVVGIFHADAPFWQANLIFTTLDATSQIFDQPQLVTEFLVECRSGYGPHVREWILRDVHFTTADDRQRLRLRVVAREDMQALLPRGLLHREGLFNLHYVLLVVVLLAFVWLRFFNGWWIASVFISGVGTSPTFTVPYRLAPAPVLLSLVLSVVITMTGSLYSAWRAAIATPVSTMR